MYTCSYVAIDYHFDKIAIALCSMYNLRNRLYNYTEVLRLKIFISMFDL